MKFIAFLLLLLLAVPNASIAAVEQEATVDLAEDFVPVTEDFDGAHMMVFGALQSTKSDIVVVFQGPAAKALVRAKVRQMGIWINGEPETLEPVTSFYAVLSSQPLDKIVSEETRKELGLGINTLKLDGKAGEGFLQNRVSKGLYVELEGAVKIRDKKLFRADINLPPNVPVGEYTAMIYEIQKGVVKAKRATTFKVAQVGIGSSIKNMANNRPFLYALMSIGLVLVVGGSAAYGFRRMS